ncbi:MAG: efflux RND transporter periplasmic adaptor subunit [Chitinophagales bacterium]|nr:efflux RND transporter periplasmic adaptor subunit [Bacteroidota bacterium]MBX7141955.1 efflux RND transporter periplasmic adaptor subunit [Chitinophagales bacterium]
MRKIRFNIWLLLPFAAFVITSCKKAEQKAMIIPDVNVVEAGQKTVPLYVEYVGQTYGQSDVDIKPRVEGWVQSIEFKEGGQVRAGQVLYVIQDDELRNREQQAQANLAQANVMLAKAKADLDRVIPLVEMNALSKRDLDAAQANYDAQVQAVEAAKAGLNNAQTQLSYTRILSPIDGVIGVSKVQVGDYVSKSIGGSSINTVSAVGALRVRFSISENDFLKYKQSMTAEQLKNLNVQLILSDGSLFPETAKLDFANREVDPTTGSLLVQAIVENKSHMLKPGQYVKVRFESEQIENAILVPQQAINQLQNIYQVFVVNDSSKIQPRPVQVGQRVGSNWVIMDGLKPGEKVALIGNAIIKPGMVIKPVVQPYSYDSTSVNR